jgi:hypothetical protein
MFLKQWLKMILSAFCLSSWPLGFVRFRVSETLQNLRSRDPCILYGVEKNVKIYGSRILSFCNAFAAQKTNKS